MVWFKKLNECRGLMDLSRFGKKFFNFALPQNHMFSPNYTASNGSRLLSNLRFVHTVSIHSLRCHRNNYLNDIPTGGGGVGHEVIQNFSAVQCKFNHCLNNYIYKQRCCNKILLGYSKSVGVPVLPLRILFFCVSDNDWIQHDSGNDAPVRHECLNAKFTVNKCELTGTTV